LRSRQALLEILALDELEGQEGLAVGLLEAVDGGDVRVVQGREEVALALEAAESLGGRTLMPTSRSRFVSVAR